jgi:hypothetical protein
MEKNSHAKNAQSQPSDGQDQHRSRADYEKRLGILSKASAKKYNNPFENKVVDWIDWDSPEMAVDPNDERWILSLEDNLGAHPWYQSLSKERQIEVGLFRFAHTAKVGSQFEQALIAGIMFYDMEVKNNDPTFRYTMHEATEETHHIQMFQEFVNKTGVETRGASKWFRRSIPYMTPLASKMPVGFWAIILAGEEPIDHAQRLILRQHENLHPLIEKIMAVHVAEEARHISFAKTYLERHIPKMTRAQKIGFSVLFPVVLRIVADVIMRPSKEALDSVGIPKQVADDVWWGSTENRELLHKLFPESKELADNMGLRGRLGRAAWRAMGIE